MREALFFTADKVATRLKLIEPLIYRRKHLLDGFKYKALAGPGSKVNNDDFQEGGSWTRVDPFSYWGSWNQDYVLVTDFHIPEAWPEEGSYALYLPLGVSGDVFNHPEALAYIDDRIQGSVDRYHHELALSPHLQDGQSHQLRLQGWTGWPAWPPDRAAKTQLFMRDCAVVEVDPPTHELHRLASAALDNISQLQDGDPAKHALLAALDRCFKALDTRDPLPSHSFYTSVAGALHGLKQDIGQAGAPQSRKLAGIGHAHIDIAYLWTVDQARQKAGRTFANALRLMARNPDYRFSQSQPQLYQFLEQDFPELNAAIDCHVAAEQWEVLSGMWVEADVNLAGGESLVRQLLLGQSYAQQRFGDKHTKVLWLPDCFGYSWALPQLLKKADISWIVTSKLSWNQTNKMPHQLFWWQGMDGSKVLTTLLTTPREVAYLPYPACYKAELTAEEIHGTWRMWDQSADHDELMIAYGYGDGGGGPTQALIDTARAYHGMPGAPRLGYSTVKDYFERLEAKGTDHLPVWNDELYLELHRGTYTSEAWLKRANRKAEIALHNLEFLASLAWLEGTDYPAESLQELWQLLCLNQFHDILPGTAIAQVFEDCRRDHDHIRAVCDQLIREAVTALDYGCDIAVNATSFASSGLIQTAEGLTAIEPLPSYSVGPIKPIEPRSNVTAQLLPDGGALLENDFLRVELSAQGELNSLYSKTLEREALAEGQTGNQLWLFEDRPLVWDAWDIEAYIEDRSEHLDTEAKITLVSSGPLRAEIYVERQMRSSVWRQTIRLDYDSLRLDFITQVQWYEQHCLLKVAFPVDVLAQEAFYQIQFGHIARPTHANISWDAAKFEVAAHAWADLREDGFGVALFNDCKYGYDIQGNRMRLSLIKSATMPNPKADQGSHSFSYSIMPHAAIGFSEVNRQATLLNNPPWMEAKTKGGQREGQLKPIDCRGEGAILDTVKRSEDGKGVICRLYQSERRKSQFHLKVGDRHSNEVTLLEKPLDIDTGSQNLKPFEIKTLLITG